MLGKGVVIGGLLLATGIAGAQVLQHIGVGDGDTKAPSASASGRLPLKLDAGPTLQPSATPQLGAAAGVSFFSGPAVRHSPASQEGPPGGNVLFSTDPAQFDQALQSAGKISKGEWNFKPDNLLPNVIVGILPGFLDIASHPLLAPGIWDNVDGTTAWPPEIDNVQFVSNLNPQATFVPGQGIFYAKNGFNGINNNVLGADSFVDSFDIISGPPAGDNHTAISFEVMQLPGFGFPPPVFHISVYDKDDVEVGKFVMDWTINSKLFVGIITTDGTTIGRVDIWDQSGGPEGISSFALYLQGQVQVPTCPWDCEAVPDKNVGINDFLALLAGWALPGPCDFDGGGVGINDFLKLLAHWGPCPAPINDECAGKIFIDRFDSGGTLTEHFDMYGATPSPDPSQCTPAQAKDIWYCLTNVTMEKKIVTLTGSVDLLAEVTAGCDCANPGPPVTCGRLVAAAPTSFTMQAGEQVCIRLLNDLNLANDAIKGDLIIQNTPIPVDEVNVFFDPGSFFQAVADAGKVQKFFWNFKPHSVPPATAEFVAVPLDINSHGTVVDDPWTDPNGNNLWPPDVDNVQFVVNLNPQGALVAAGPDSLAFATAGFLPDINNNFLGENLGPDNAFDIISGPPAGDNHTAIAIELASTAVNVGVPPGSPVTYHVSIYDKQDVEIGKFLITGLTGDKVFAGFVTKVATIGRIDIFSEESYFDGISAIWTFVQGPPHDIERCPPPDCPPGDDPIWCVYDIINVQGDPVICEKRGIFPGGLICVTPCPFPGDLVDCDPDGTGIVTFRTVDNGCVFDAVPNNGCMPCPPGATQWRRIN